MGWCSGEGFGLGLPSPMPCSKAHGHVHVHESHGSVSLSVHVSKHSTEAMLLAPESAAGQPGGGGRQQLTASTVPQVSSLLEELLSPQSDHNQSSFTYCFLLW